MPNIVNIIQTDTFEEWRVKDNELGAVLGDLTLVNSNSKAGEDTVIVTLNNLRYETTNNAGWVGDISTLFSAPNYSTTDGTLDGTTTSYGNLTDAANRLKADADTRQAEIGNIFTLTHYSTLPTLVGTLNSHDSRLDTAEATIGSIGSLDATLHVPGTNNLVDAINANKGFIDEISSASGISLTTTFATVYDGSQTSVSSALNNDYARLNTIGYILGGTQVNGNTSASAIQTALYGTHTNLVAAINGIEDFVLTNSKWDGTDNKSLIWALNNHESRLDTEENNVDLLQGDVGTWSNYEGMMAGNGWTQGNITDAIINIRTRQDNLTGDFVNATGDTMTGSLTFTTGGVQATGQYLNLGVGGTDTIRISTTNRIGVGKAAHGSYKVDVSGTLNATNLRIGGEQLDDRYLEVTTTGGVDVVGANIRLQGNTYVENLFQLGTKIIYDNGVLEFDEVIQDIAGTMFEGNTESGGIYASYSDSTGKITLGISDDGHSHVIGNIDNFTENVQDIVGSMVSTNVESGINVTYDDSTGKVNFDVNDPTITLTGDVTGTATMSNLGSFSINTTVGSNNIALGTDTTGNYVGSGNTTGNGLSGSVSTEGGTFTVNSNATSSNTGNTIVFRDGSGNFSAGTVYARATSANYADLAENYVADEQYPSGTVLSFGGESEVTQSSEDGDTRIIGVVSTNPAYLMHADCAGEFVVAVALTGRVLCGVSGSIKKGDMMVSDGTGRARASQSPTMGSVIGKALENSEGDNVIEVVVGKL